MSARPNCLSKLRTKSMYPATRLEEPEAEMFADAEVDLTKRSAWKLKKSFSQRTESPPPRRRWKWSKP